MITILFVSDGHKHFSTPIDEYKKRTNKYLRHIAIKPVSHTNSEYIVVKETLAIKESLKKLTGTIYLLDERGTSLRTEAFTDLLEDAKNTSENLIFVIGGSYGVDLELL
jgi:23S rRNA pseudoU1915 N3-methylase RlmH